MAELLTPGVYIKEVAFGPQPIEGVSTTTAGFVGETERGPVGEATLVTSFPDYQRKFGGFVNKDKHLPYAIRGFFDNGGRRAYIVRVLGAGASSASQGTNTGYEVALLAGPQSAVTAGNIVLRVASVVGAVTGATVTLFPVSGIGATIVLNIASINSVSSSLELTLPVESPPVDLSEVTPATHALRYIAAAGADIVEFSARDEGAFGERLAVLATPIYLAATRVTGVVTTNTVFEVAQVGAFAVGQTIEFEGTGGKQYGSVSAVNVPAAQITVTGVTGVAIDDTVRITGWRVDVYFDGALVETVGGISSNNSATDGIVEKVNAESGWIRVTATPSPTIGIGAITGSPAFPAFAFGRPLALTGGSDGAAVSATNVIGIDNGGQRTGLRALEAQQGISLIAAPGFTGTTYQAVANELIGQAERRMDRFAVLESANEPDIQDVLAFRGNFNTQFAAMYHPWVRIQDPVSGNAIDIPPAGHVLGAYARTDIDRGVFKAPANVTLRSILGFSHAVPDGEQDILNPAGVNVLRQFDGLGQVIWGARTLSAESLWRYVSVRRLFIFIEQSLVRGTRFAVFEPNDLRLWARLRDGVANFLTTQWRAGALFGARPEEAFFVKVDETTTTQDDRDNGRVNIVIGIAPVRPAEFVVIEIGQAPQSVIISEQG